MRPESLAQVLHQRTEGHPLFLVAVVEEFVRQGVVQQGPMGWTLSEGIAAVSVAVPESLRQLVERQLEQLPPDAQQILEAASLVGLEFAAAAAAAAEQGVEAVEERAAILARRGQFVQTHGAAEWPDGTVTTHYGFRHALCREILYARVPMSRRRRWHRQIGLRLQAGYGPRARELAAELAEHFVRGRDTTRAVHYLRQAAETASQRCAYREAIGHLTQGLELLKPLPNTPARAEQELALLTPLGPALMATQGRGSPAVERVYIRARELCQQVGETPQLFPVLHGLCLFYRNRGQLRASHELAEQCLTLARRVQDPALLMLAHEALGGTLFWLGEAASARDHLQEGIALYYRQQSRVHAFLYRLDPGIYCLGFAALILWLLGYPGQALDSAHELLALAQKLSHPLSMALALNFTAFLHQLRGEGPLTQERAEAVVALATDLGFEQRLAAGTLLRGWALAEQGREQEAEGITQIRQGLAAWQAIGEEIWRPYFLSLLAEVYGKVGQTKEGLCVLTEALVAVHNTGECCWEAELYRLKGELLLMQARGADGRAPLRSEAEEAVLTEPESCFRQALASGGAGSSASRGCGHIADR